MKSTIKKGLVIASLAVVASVASAAEGKEVFEANCAKCHGADGKGDTKMGKMVGVKDLTAQDLTEDQISAAIKDGVKKGDKTVMKAFSDLSADDVKALVAYVKSLKK